MECALQVGVEVGPRLPVFVDVGEFLEVADYIAGFFSTAARLANQRVDVGEQKIEIEIILLLCDLSAGGGDLGIVALLGMLL